MFVITKEDVTPSLIPNTSMQKVFRDGVHQGYYVTPAEGYVLHDKAGDYEDPETLEYHATFATGSCGCSANYDFTPVETSYVDRNGNTVLVTAYGAGREFYAVAAESPSEDEIYGGNDDHKDNREV